MEMEMDRPGAILGNSSVEIGGSALNLATTRKHTGTKSHNNRVHTEFGRAD